MDKLIQASPCGDEGVLTPGQVQQWQTEGYTFASGIFPEEFIESLGDAARLKYPEPDSKEAGEINDFNSINISRDNLSALYYHPLLLLPIA